MSADRARAALGVLLLVFGFDSALGQGANTGRVSLAIAVRPGRPVLFVLRTSETEELAVSQKLEAQGVSVPLDVVGQETEFALEISNKLEDGRYRGIVSFGRQSADSGTVGLDKKPLVARSDGEPPPKDLRRGSVLGMVALGEQEFTVTLDSGGFVTDVEGEGVTLAGRAKAFGLEGLDKVQFESTAYPGIAARTVNAAHFATPFPAKEVAVGTSWKDDDMIARFRTYFEICLRRTVRVRQVHDRDVSLEATGNVEVRKRTLPKLPDIGIDLKIEKITVKSSKVASSMRISRTDGLPLEAATEATLVYQAGHGLDMRWTWKATLQRKDFWPSGKSPKRPEPDPPPEGK